MRDADVRKALKRELLKQHQSDADTLVLEELGLRHGVTRVDIAVVNGALHGHEIKSNSDTLERLPAQIATYSLVLDKATLVVGERHSGKAMAMLPDWWGVKIATQGPRGGISFYQEKFVRTNPSVDPLAVAELLWSNEVREILRELGFAEKELRKPRAHLYRELVAAIELDKLRATIRRVLKGRERWRCPSQPA